MTDGISIITEAEPYQESDQALVARLAALPPLEYERCRKEEARRMGVRVTELDSMVRALRSKDDTSGAGRELTLPEPEPWPDAVHGVDLLDGLVAAFRRYLVLLDGAAEAKALWVLHTHVIDTAQVTPRLALLSPEKRCGKTLALSILQRLVRRPLPASNITAAAVFRTVEMACPTLLIDEAHTFLPKNDELRGILDSGHSRSMGYVVRLVGDDHEPRLFATFAAVAIAAIGKLAGTIEDRSIIIHMHRKTQDERIERLRMDRTPDLDKLARMAARWAKDNQRVLADADPETPEALHDRASDNWRHLLAIADLAGGEWPQRARAVALHLSGSQDADDSSDGVQLLTDLAALFDERNTDRLSSKDICDALADSEDRPWPEFKNGKPITPRQVAKLLKSFGPQPKQIRISDETKKGYMKSWFDYAFARYIPSVSETPKQDNVINVLEENLSETVAPGVSDKNDGKPSIINDVSDVSDRTGGLRANGEVESQAVSADAFEEQPALEAYPYVYRDEQDRRVYKLQLPSGEAAYLASSRSLLEKVKFAEGRVVIFYDELPHLRQADDEMKEAFLHAKRVFGPGVAIVESDNGPAPSLASGDTDR